MKNFPPPGSATDGAPRRTLPLPQWSVHYRSRLAHFRHNLTTLEFDIFPFGTGIMRGRLSSALRRLAQFGACAVLCLLVANCADKRQCRLPLRRLAERAAGFDRASRCPRAAASIGSARPIWSAAASMSRRTTRNYNAVGLASWYGDDFHGRETANGEIFDVNSHLRGASDVAVAELCAGDEPQQRPLADRARQRSRALCTAIASSTSRCGRRICLASPIAASPGCASQYVGRAPMEGSDDRVLASTLRENEPAPAPWDVRLAATPLLPAFPRSAAADPA